MSDYKFNCPHCEQSLEAPADMLGETTECPVCKGLIQIPKPNPKLRKAPRPENDKPPSVSKKRAKNEPVPDDEKPPTKTQINRIIKLGGDPEKATNRDEAEDYIWDLEQIREDEKDRKEDEKYQLESRAQSAIENFYTFYDAEDREMVAMKKPSMAVMKKAILYGDEQDWGKDWDDPARGTNKEYEEESLIEVAVYAVAPQLLKREYMPPEPEPKAPHPIQSASKK